MKPLIAIVAMTLGLSVTQGVASADEHRDFKKEESNRALVVKFYNKFFNDHLVDEAAVVIAEEYVQHNPMMPDGKAPLVNYFSGFFKENPAFRNRIVRSAADGNLVWLHVHSTNGNEDRGQAIVDLFRVQDGLIVEHWDVIQPVATQSANINTMF